MFWLLKFIEKVWKRSEKYWKEDSDFDDILMYNVFVNIIKFEYLMFMYIK